MPYAGHAVLIDESIADPNAESIALTTEEEGVAMMAGADLGGARGVLMMQSSGVGSCINLLSLINACHFPFLTLISMRGDLGEGNSWQMAMGKAGGRADPRSDGRALHPRERTRGRRAQRAGRADHGLPGRRGDGGSADAEAHRREEVLKAG